MLPIRQTVDRPPSLPPVQVARNDDRPEPNLARLPARSLARFHLRKIGQRIDAVLKVKAADADETTLAHLEECKERIAKVLSASMQAND